MIRRELRRSPQPKRGNFGDRGRPWAGIVLSRRCKVRVDWYRLSQVDTSVHRTLGISEGGDGFSRSINGDHEKHPLK